MHVTQGDLRGHVRVRAGHVAVEQQRRAAGQLEEVAGEDVELGLGTVGALLNAQRVILADRRAHVQATVLAVQVLDVPYRLAGRDPFGQRAERVDPVVGCVNDRFVLRVLALRAGVRLDGLRLACAGYDILPRLMESSIR